MSDLIFDGMQHQLSYYNKQGTPIGDGWYANNIVDRAVKNLRFLPNGLYWFLDTRRPHQHGQALDKQGIKLDSTNGSFGKFGIFRLKPFTVAGVPHSGVGIHSGRSSKGGADHPTHGCIRTTDDVIEAICYYIANDPLHTLTVVNNYDQHHRHPHFQGDCHLDVSHLA